MGKRGRLAIILAVIMLNMSIFPQVAGQENGEGEDCTSCNRIAVLETDYGTITFMLYENITPITTANFIGLAESGHYTNVLFHRIVDDFVIQTGDGGGTGDPIPLEIHPNATHVDGAVGMARSDDPDSAEDQFYICDGAQHGLDGDYAVFGIVTEGMEVVREIAQVPVYGENNPRPGAGVPLLWKNVGMPKEDVFLKTVTIEVPEEEEERRDPAQGFDSVNISPWVLLLVLIPVLIIIGYFVIVRRRFGYGG
jgi:cyclophilin family peptidyl-prolyl cis-trans isomerase